MKAITQLDNVLLSISRQCYGVVRFGFIAVLATTFLTSARADGPTRLESIPREHRQFELVGEPNQDDTPGALKGGGYCWRDVTVTKRRHRAIGREFGGATVETISHPSDYPFIIHDFFGTFFGAGQRRPPAREMAITNGVVRDGEIEWRFVSWIDAEQTVMGNICANVVAKKEGGFAGSLGWYSRDDDGIKTVMMFFDNLDGVPVQLIDGFLKQYPSSVKEEDFHGEAWVADDVRKWVRLLGLLRGDRDRLGFALSRLAAYDDKFFGVDRTRLDPADTVVFNQAIDDLAERADRWLAERDKARRGLGDK